MLSRFVLVVKCHRDEQSGPLLIAGAGVDCAATPCQRYRSWSQASAFPTKSATRSSSHFVWSILAISGMWRRG